MRRFLFIFIFYQLITDIAFPVNAKICSYSGYCSSSGDCVAGNICQKYSPHYSQCIPDTNIPTCIAEYHRCSILLACCPSSNCTRNPHSNNNKCLPLPCTDPSGFSTQKVQLNRPFTTAVAVSAAVDLKNAFSGSLVRYLTYIYTRYVIYQIFNYISYINYFILLIIGNY